MIHINDPGFRNHRINFQGPKVSIKIFFCQLDLWLFNSMWFLHYCYYLLAFEFLKQCVALLNVSNGASPHQPSIKCILISNMHRLVMEKIDTFYNFKIWLKTKGYGISYNKKAHTLVTLKLYKIKRHSFINTIFHPNKIDNYRFWWDVESYKIEILQIIYWYLTHWICKRHKTRIIFLSIIFSKKASILNMNPSVPCDKTMTRGM